MTGITQKLHCFVLTTTIQAGNEGEAILQADTAFWPGQKWRADLAPKQEDHSGIDSFCMLLQGWTWVVLLEQARDKQSQVKWQSMVQKRPIKPESREIRQ